MKTRGESGVLIALAIALAGGLTWWMGAQERRVVAMASEAPGHNEGAAGAASGDRSAALLRVAELLERTQLICVEIRGSVEARSDDPSWRGDVLAGVRVPVRLFYGTDLSAADGLAPMVSSSPLGGGVLVRVPMPRRLATEVLTDAELTSVKVSGLRFRDIAGEFHLGQARTKTHEAARALKLTPEQESEVRRITRERIATLVSAVLGPGVDVDVILEPAPEDRELSP